MTFEEFLDRAIALLKKPDNHLIISGWTSKFHQEEVPWRTYQTLLRV
jgi:hypothetical protein